MTADKKTFYQREKFPIFSSSDNSEPVGKQSPETVWFKTLLQQLVIGEIDQKSDLDCQANEDCHKHRPENYLSSYQYIAELAWQIETKNASEI